MFRLPSSPPSSLAESLSLTNSVACSSAIIANLRAFLVVRAESSSVSTFRRGQQCLLMAQWGQQLSRRAVALDEYVNMENFRKNKLTLFCNFDLDTCICLTLVCSSIALLTCAQFDQTCYYYLLWAPEALTVGSVCTWPKQVLKKSGVQFFAKEMNHNFFRDSICTEAHTSPIVNNGADTTRKKVRCWTETFYSLQLSV